MGHQPSGLHDVRKPVEHIDDEGAAGSGALPGPRRSLRQGGERHARRGDLRQDQGPFLYRRGWLRLHLQAPFAGRAALVPERPRRSQEVPLHWSGPPGASIPRVPRRDTPMVRLLAQGRRHRHHGRTSGQDLGHGSQQVASCRGLAVAGDAMDPVLPR